MTTTSLRAWFTEFTSRTGETIQKIVLNEDRYDWEDGPELLFPPKVVIDFTEIDPAVLDRGFDDGWGGTNSPDFCAWSENWVVLSCQYDGAEWPVWVPRHPKDHTPARPGGG